MKAKGFLTYAIIVFALNVAVFAQEQGDLNCNGFVDIDDLIRALNLVNSCDMQLSDCAIRNGDLDGDGRPMTIGDLLFMPSLVVPGPPPPDFSRHPGFDTITVESAITRPGETITLPLWVKTIDTLAAFQFLLEVDTDYIECDTVIVHDDYSLAQNNCDGDIYCHSMADIPFSYILLLPGSHYIADIVISVDGQINPPVTTRLVFSSIPSNAVYSGFANSTFFEPVMVDAEIEILPLSDVESADESIPTDFSITAYPNPFNDALNISVFSDRATQITVYDVMGRPVKTFDVNAGDNLINWNATDDNHQTISAGIYFMGEKESGGFKKATYLK